MKKVISAAVVLIFVCLPGGSYAMERPVQGPTSDFPLVVLPGDAPGAADLVLAANEQTPGASQVDSKPEEKVETPQEKKDPPKTPPKPLKPFVPSEKVKAGQAVDFPYDI